MKNYEGRTQLYLPRRTYTMMRLDGKAFHSYTKYCERPFDLGLMEDMDNTAKSLCERIQGCRMAYVQSDEITLVLTDFENLDTQAWFDGNIQKQTSISAAMAAAHFNQLRTLRLLKIVKDTKENTNSTPNFQDIYEAQSLAYFDSRVWTVSQPEEVVNNFVWRQQDATRNSIQMAAQSMFSHKELQSVSCDELQEKMWSEKSVNWNDYPIGFKRGRTIVKDEYLVMQADHSCPSRSVRPQYVKRSRWIVAEPPVFTKDREYILSRIG